jgi:hypothetical protein
MTKGAAIPVAPFLLWQEFSMRRAHFKFSWIAIALLAPKSLIIFIFFYWPTAQALYRAFTLEQPWGGGNTGSGSTVFATCCRSPIAGPPCGCR